MREKLFALKNMLIADWAAFNWSQFKPFTFAELTSSLTGKERKLELTLAFIASIILFFILFVDEPLAHYVKTLDPGVSEFFGSITEIGSSAWLIICSLGLILACLIGCSFARHKKTKYAFTLIRQWSWYFLAVVALLGLSVNLVKYMLGRARPKYLEELGALEFEFFIFESGFASFPSGHTTTAISAAVALGIIFPRLKVYFITIGLWVGLSRVMVGAHYISDITAGFVYGTVGAWIFYHYFLHQSFFKAPTKKRRRIIYATCINCLRQIAHSNKN